MSKPSASSLVHSFRLQPGTDLLDGISDYVAKHRLRACHVVSCVGSLTSATLRLAKPSSHNKERIRTRHEHFEIVSVTGTVEWNPSGEVTKHVHIALADEDGAVWGGHMLSSLDGVPRPPARAPCSAQTTVVSPPLLDTSASLSRSGGGTSGPTTGTGGAGGTTGNTASEEEGAVPSSSEAVLPQSLQTLYPVYTTAEVALLVDEGVSFSREPCPRSGWPELVVRECGCGG